MPHHLHFWGVRGSMPVGGAETARYGGHTPCITVDGGGRSHIVLDAGTGIHRFQKTLADPGPDGWDFHVLFTHFHLDHIIGLPFFKPLFDARNRFTFYGYPYDGRPVDEVVHGILAPPWFPVALADVPASQTFIELTGEPLSIAGIDIQPDQLEHPQGVAAFRLMGPERSVVLATDYERGVSTHLDARLDRLASGVDVLIHDAQYTPEEYVAEHKGWGHSTWEMAVESATAAGAKELILMSHDPDRSDEEVDALVEAARQSGFPIRAAYEGLSLDI
ncbi:MAG: MBL fold metallo-hydrolase [Acidimicrobiia bacterium]|nr:MBL fold metallo-hydrolase [Acidimicrobiia bacterium]MDH5422796.1 MBL fold metallo-hydrolase [Acidimicrobiia bacterium]MDH5503904.1 MBL fold metallo-hydrolase [Acidimicrobiia bacterium]